MREEYEIKVMGDIPITFVQGDGMYVKDATGKEYLDATSAEWVLNLGYRNRQIMDAVKKQLEQIEYVSPVYDCAPRALLAKKLAEIAPGDLKKTLFALSGAGANEAAMHLAMRKTGGQEFIVFYQGFHGRTLGTIPLSYTEPMMLPECKIGLERYLTKQTRIPNFYCYRCYYELEYPECGAFCMQFIETALKHSVDSKPAGVFFEVVQANGGVIVAPEKAMEVGAKICKDNGIALIVDEVQTAFCRCGSLFASDLYHLKPDIVTLGKSIGGGFPLAAAIATEEYSNVKRWELGWTQLGHPVACAASLAMIDVMQKQKLAENAAGIGKMMKDRLNEIAKRYPAIGDVRGLGLMIGIEFVKDPKTKKPANDEVAYLAKKAYEKGLLLGTSGPAFGPYGNVVKMKPAVNLKEEHADKILGMFEEVLKEAKSEGRI
jgi:4-aminobutyrate aminotransferase-like enzyme